MRRRRIGAGEAWLLVRMTGWCLAFSVLKHGMPLPRLTRLVWRGRPGSPSQAEIERIVQLAHAAARVGPRRRRGWCLERSLVAYRYLSMAGARPSLVVGMRREQDAYAGHAWVTIDGRPVREPESTEAHTVLLELGTPEARA